LVGQKEVSRDSLFNKDFLNEIKKKVLVFSRKTEPLHCTHDLVDPNDIIIKKFKEANLNNSVKDKVKVIFYPTYLNGSDGLLNLNYYECISGSHLGVFPSYYEPWGYTPMETGALGVASVTSDLTGFGRFISQFVEGKKHPGIFLLKFLSASTSANMGGPCSESDVVGDLSDIMHKFAKLSVHERVQNKIAARDIAARADWKVLIKNYLDAYEMAITK
jgi:glycogen(starch) synthase